jgi:hypothetical protein
MSSAEHVLGLVGIVLAYALVGAFCLRAFARALSFTQAFTICLAAFAVGNGLFITYFEFNFRAALPSWAEPIIWTVFALIPLALINWLARKRGIEKTGWCGVGTKTYISVTAINWALIGVFVTVRHFL